MKFIIIGIVLLAGIFYYLIKTGKAEDKNKNGIPDVVEDKAKEIKEEVVEQVKKRVRKPKK